MFVSGWLGSDNESLVSQLLTLPITSGGEESLHTKLGGGVHHEGQFINNYNHMAIMILYNRSTSKICSHCKAQIKIWSKSQMVMGNHATPKYKHTRGGVWLTLTLWLRCRWWCSHRGSGWVGWARASFSSASRSQMTSETAAMLMKIFVVVNSTKGWNEDQVWGRVKKRLRRRDDLQDWDSY